MTQRSNHSQTDHHRTRRPAVALRKAADTRALELLTKIAPLSALILVLVLITGLASAEYGFV
ncbi:hypothetical protein JI752_016330 [Lysobacter sp. MMG2]|uniref:hypothetical protein n=1 Tax=Lysobacter sp. MMG2 TaxID=2801338 RepID=UPI001C245B5C|nr:hypothetical protein [Lysobacter sp. MMG2]MBU8977717.1 hypothetical protein [Lysobacter sp. MMG2]